MALTLVLEDGTGLSTANVYDSTASAFTWLSDRGYTSFVAASSTVQGQSLLSATELVESWSEGRPTGYLLQSTQALLWPRNRATDRRQRLWGSSDRPTAYREAIYLVADKYASAVANGKTLSIVDGTSNLSSEAVEGKFTREYRGAGQGPQDLFPEVWLKLNTCWPPGIRSRHA